MNQIQVVGDYIEEKLPNLKKKKGEDGIYTFEEKEEEKILCIVKEKYLDSDPSKPLLFTPNEFHLYLSESERNINADYYAFNFGGINYYVKGSEVEKPKFHILRYLGKYEIDNSDFAHLGIHSTYSLLNGCQKISEWIDKANYLNVKALGICERNSLASVLKFQNACKKAKLKYCLGEEVKVKYEGKFYWFKLYVKNKEGWINLLKISNHINVTQKRMECDFITMSDFNKILDNLIIILPNDFPFEDLSKNFEKYDCYYQIDTVEWLNQDYYYQYLNNIKEYRKYFQKKFPPVLIGDSYYLDEEDGNLRKVVKDIGNKGEFEYACKSLHFKSIDEHIEIFSKFWERKPEVFDNFMGIAIENTMEIVKKCNGFEIKFEKLHIPLARISQAEYDKAIQKRKEFESNKN